MKWTVERVKKELPNVPLRLGQTIHQAKVSGRLNDQATVTIFNSGTLHRNTWIWKDYHFGWDSLVNSLNSETPLNGDD